MILGFTKLNPVTKKETGFKEKILKGIKLHTIREDFYQRWKPGMKIHFATGARSPQYECFKEGQCKSVQNIYIGSEGLILVDGTRLSPIDIEELAVNDGFDNVEDFWAWFSIYTPFGGRLIHWSELKY